MLLAPPCGNTAHYGASFSAESEGNYMGATSGASWPLCQNGGRKRRKKTKKKKAGAAVVASIAAAGIYATALSLVELYNIFLKPKREKPLTVTQATIDYVKMKGTDVLNNLRGMDRSQQRVVFKDYEAYIKTHPKENRMVIRRAPKKKDDEFKITSDEDDDYELARSMARTKKRTRRKRSRKKRSRRKRSRRKRSQRGGAALSPNVIAEMMKRANTSAEKPTKPTKPPPKPQKNPPKVPSRPPPKQQKNPPKVPSRPPPKQPKNPPKVPSTRPPPKQQKNPPKVPSRPPPNVPARPSSGTVLPGMTPGGGFGGRPSWKGKLEPSGSDLERNYKSFGV